MSRVVVHAFPDEAEPAGRLAKALGVELGLVDLHVFPDGECLPTPPAPASTVIVYRSLDRPDAKLVPLLLAADAWRRAGARRLVLVAPYLCYLRQDAVFRPRQPLSRDVVAGLLGPPFDRLVTVDPHLHRTPDLGALWKKPVTVVSAAPVLAEAVGGEAGAVVLGPDVESSPWAAALGAALDAPHGALQKERLGDRDVSLTSRAGPDVEGRRVVLVDDICSSGATLAQAARLVLARGARVVDVAVTHAICDAETLQRLHDAGVRRFVSTDSCAASVAQAAPLADLLARAVQDEVAGRLEGDRPTGA